jgi:CheY-like chemotaxis protein
MKLRQQPPIDILLADDDKDDRFFFGKALKALPRASSLTIVNNGEQLMDYLFEKVMPLPDILFLDLNMPRKNGHECLVEIKKDERLKGIPIIIYSTSLREEMADTLYASGAHYYLRKCDFAELPACISRVVTLLAENADQPSRDSFIIR